MLSVCGLPGGSVDDQQAALAGSDPEDELGEVAVTVGDRWQAEASAASATALRGARRRAPTTQRMTRREVWVSSTMSKAMMAVGWRLAAC